MEFKKAEAILQQVTKDIFSTMLDTDLQAGAGSHDPEPFFQSEVTGLIGIAGELAGYVSLHCQNQQAAEFTARFLGMDVSSTSSIDDVRDAIGELVNMLAGGVKTEYGGRLEIALPTVVMTPKPDMRVKGSSGVLVPFDDTSGTFYVELVVMDT